MSFGGVGAGLGEIRPADGHLHRRGRAEAHHLVDDVGRLEGELHVRQRLGQFSAEFLLELLDADAAFPLQGHPHHGVLRPPHPLKHGVDRVGGGNRAEVAQGHLHVVRSGGLLDDLEGLQGNLLGPVDVRSVRGADAKAELPGVDGREDLRAQPRAQPPDDRHATRRDTRPRDPSGSGRSSPAATRSRAGTDQRRLREANRAGRCGGEARGRSDGEAAGCDSPRCA